MRGNHEGGLAATAPVIGGNAATVAAKTRQRDARRKKLSSTLLQYILDKALQSKLRGGGNGEQQWALYKQLEAGAKDEAASESMKASMRAATILGAVGFNESSIQRFDNWLHEKNGQIEAADRMDEHELSIIMLKAIGATGQPTIASAALKEFTCPPAQRQYTQPAPNPTHLRSLSEIVQSLGREWKTQVENNLISKRAAGGTQRGAGNSTRVDANEIVEGMAMSMTTDE